jgi:hypothetical protein
VKSKKYVVQLVSGTLQASRRDSHFNTAFYIVGSKILISPLDGRNPLLSMRRAHPRRAISSLRRQNLTHSFSWAEFDSSWPGCRRVCVHAGAEVEKSFNLQPVILNRIQLQCFFGHGCDRYAPKKNKTNVHDPSESELTSRSIKYLGFLTAFVFLSTINLGPEPRHCDTTATMSTSESPSARSVSIRHNQLFRLPSDPRNQKSEIRKKIKV